MELPADLPYAEVQPLLEVDKSVLAPDRQPDLLARHQRSAMLQQERKHARRLLLNPHRRAVLAKLKRLLVELEFTESDGWHGGDIGDRNFAPL